METLNAAQMSSIDSPMHGCTSQESRDVRGEAKSIGQNNPESAVEVEEGPVHGKKLGSQVSREDVTDEIKFPTTAAIVSHTFAYGPQDAIFEYMAPRTRLLLMITHPLHPFVRDARTSALIVERGNLLRNERAGIRHLPPLLGWLSNAALAFLFVMKSRTIFDVYIGCNSVNTLPGLLLEKLGRVRAVVYFAHSSQNRRYSNPILNGVYRAIDLVCVEHSSVLWNLSSRLTDRRAKAGVNRRRNIYLPVGVESSFIMPEAHAGADPNQLVFVGALTKEKGVDLALKSMPLILKSAPRAHLTIVGSGPEEGNLRDAVKVIGLRNHVTFLGNLRHAQVLSVLRRSGIGLAPYPPLPDSSVWTTEPTKPKEYIAAGVPVITTRIVEYADLIAEAGAGIIINYDASELSQAVVKLISDATCYRRCEQGAAALAREFSWNGILRKLFAETIPGLGSASASRRSR